MWRIFVALLLVLPTYALAGFQYCIRDGSGITSNCIGSIGSLQSVWEAYVRSKLTDPNTLLLDIYNVQTLTPPDFATGQPAEFSSMGSRRTYDKDTQQWPLYTQDITAVWTRSGGPTPTPPNSCPAAGTSYAGATAYVGLKKNACTGTGCSVVLSDVRNCNGPVCDATFTSTGQSCTDQPPPPSSNNDCPTGTLYAEFDGQGRCVAVSNPVTPAPTTPTPGPSPTPAPPTTPVPGDGGGTGGGGGSGGGGGTTPGDGEGEGGEGSEYCKDNPGSLICIKVTKPGQSGSYDLDAVKQELADAQSEWNDLMATIQEELADLVDFDIGGGSSMAWSTRIFGSREVAVDMSDLDEIWTYIPMLLMFLAALACAFILFDL